MANRLDRLTVQAEKSKREQLRREGKLTIAQPWQPLKLEPEMRRALELAKRVNELPSRWT